MSNQKTPRVYPHLDSYVRADGLSKFFIRVHIGRTKRLYPIDLNGQQQVLMDRRYWKSVVEDGKVTREKYIQHAKGNTNSRQIQRIVDAAVIKMEELIAELGRGNRTISHDLLQPLWSRRGIDRFSEWAWNWAQEYCLENNLSEGTLARYKWTCRAIEFYEDHVGPLPLQSISAIWFKKFQAWVVRPKETDSRGTYKGFGWSLTNGSKAVSTIGTIFKHATLNGELTSNPHQEFVDRGWYEHYEKETIRFLEEDEVERLYEAYLKEELKGYQIKCGRSGKGTRSLGDAMHHRLGIYLFTIFTGLRYQDIKAIGEGRSDVSIGRTHLSLIMSKSVRKGSEGKRIRLKITERMRRVANLSGEGPVFATKVQTKWNTNENLRRILKAVGIQKYITFHDLRRTFATSLLSKGARMKVVSSLIGHESIRTTEKHYAKVVDKAADEAMELWDDLESAFTDPAVRAFVEDVFVLLQDNPNVRVRQRLLDKVEALTELLELADLEKKGGDMWVA